MGFECSRPSPSSLLLLFFLRLAPPRALRLPLPSLELLLFFLSLRFPLPPLELSRSLGLPPDLASPASDEVRPRPLALESAPPLELLFLFFLSRTRLALAKGQTHALGLELLCFFLRLLPSAPRLALLLLPLDLALWGGGGF